MHFDLIIAGGGLAGASFAVALRGSRYRIALIEGRLPAPRATDRESSFDARIYTISPGNARFLDDIGVWRHLDAGRLTPVHEMEIHGDRVTQLGSQLGTQLSARLSFSAYEKGVDELAWVAEASLMQHELWETLRRQANVTLFCPAQPQSLAFSSNAAALTLNDGTTLSAQLVVAADGIDSWVRQAAGIHADIRPYGEMGVVANLQCEKPHHNTAFQWFRNDGVLAYLPLPENKVSIVWSTPDAHASELMGLPAEEFSLRVAAAGAYRLGAMAMATPPAAFPLRMMRAKSMIGPRLALIGDAAHAIHPLAGQGINLGFRDARALAQVLHAAPVWDNCGSLSRLRRYERSRAEEVMAFTTTTHALQRLFGSRNATLAALRNAGLNLADKLPVVRQLLMSYALR